MRLWSLPSLVILVVILLFVIPSAAGFYTDWLWFRELGYQHVFVRTIDAQAIVFGVTFALVYLFLYFNLRFARRRTLDRPHVVFGTSPDGRPLAVDSRQLFVHLCLDAFDYFQGGQPVSHADERAAPGTDTVQKMFRLG